MKTFEQWCDGNSFFDCTPAYIARKAWDDCAAEHEHRIANIEQAKNMKIRLLERQIEELKTELFATQEKATLKYHGELSAEEKNITAHSL